MCLIVLVFRQQRETEYRARTDSDDNKVSYKSSQFWASSPAINFRHVVYVFLVCQCVSYARPSYDP
jgi:hypothetical protein